MKPVEFRHGDIQIDASVIAEGLGIALPVLRQQMRAGKITSLSERGVDADLAQHRVLALGHRPERSCGRAKLTGMSRTLTPVNRQGVEERSAG